jgi:hypothetical protein
MYARNEQLCSRGEREVTPDYSAGGLSSAAPAKRSARVAQWGGALLIALCLASLPALADSEPQSVISELQGKPLSQVLYSHGLTMGQFYYLQATSHPSGLFGVPDPETPVVAPAAPSMPISEATEPSPRMHFFFRLGGDAGAGPYFELGPGVSGFWGEPRLLGEVFFTANAEFLVSSLVAELIEEWLGFSIGVPGEFTLSPLGQAVGAGTQLRLFSEYTEPRGAHGFGIGLGATGFFTQSDLGAPFAVLGHACLSASWPFVELNLSYRFPVWTSNPKLTKELKGGTIGLSIGLRDPLSPLVELLGGLSK